jgi:hypothetical protein
MEFYITFLVLEEFSFEFRSAVTGLGIGKIWDVEIVFAIG